jgi:hypothetical protein
MLGCWDVVYLSAPGSDLNEGGPNSALNPTPNPGKLGVRTPHQTSRFGDVDPSNNSLVLDVVAGVLQHHLTPTPFSQEFCPPILDTGEAHQDSKGTATSSCLKMSMIQQDNKITVCMLSQRTLGVRSHRPR